MAVEDLADTVIEVMAAFCAALCAVVTSFGGVVGESVETPTSPTVVQEEEAVVEAGDGHVGEAPLQPPADDATCDVVVWVQPALRPAAQDALAVLAPTLGKVELRIGDNGAAGDVSIRFGGEWPTHQPQLGWTAPDRRTVLINPDHPFVDHPSALAEVIAHEMGHVLIGPGHVGDGTLLDPHLDGVITLGDADVRELGALTCADLGL